ncbi:MULTISPECIES: recombinase family protein [Bacillus]|uniref:recombinase family protein n=1 Tax=Bacillus TaxID=1386 RepID=UPI001ABCB535|nr:recombinase family protein [Bacillus subtilis]MBO3637734.1 recombinase family protein [Bacillus subtilis]
MAKELTKTVSVAAYLRKSREDADQEDTLARHRKQLIDLVKQRGFENVDWYEEIGSADSIKNRPVFSDLLKKIENDEYDAVCVVAYDRLSRGNQIESGIISKAFKDTETLLITPTRTYDWSIEGDEMLSEFESMIARSEYRVIKKRLKQGKINAVRNGRLHSGNVPYGYKWDKNDKTAKIDKEKHEIYRLMVKWFLDEEYSATEIADKLNELGIPSPSGGSTWYSEVVADILTNDFHRGLVWYGKYRAKKNGIGIEKNPDNSSIIMHKGNHESMKSDEEHGAIIRRISKLRTFKPGRKLNKNTFKLSGLVRCPHCGKVQVVHTPKNRNPHVRKCLKKSKTRTTKCNNTTGIPEEALYKAIVMKIREYNEILFSKESSEKKDEEARTYMNQILSLHEKAISKSNKRIEKIKEMYMDEIIDKDEFKSRIEKEKKSIQEAENEIRKLKESADYHDEIEHEQRKIKWNHEKVQEFIESDQGFTPSEINLILKLIISHVSYTMVKNEYGEFDVDLRVNFN